MFESGVDSILNHKLDITSYLHAILFTVDIWRTRQVFETLKTQCSFTSILRLTEIKTRQTMLSKSQKKFINGCRIAVVSVTRKKTPFWGRGGILHLSYRLNEIDDPYCFLSFLYYAHIIKFNPGNFKHICYF